MDINEDKINEFKQEANEEYLMRTDYEYFLENSRVDEIAELVKGLINKHYSFGWDYSIHNIFKEIKERL